MLPSYIKDVLAVDIEPDRIIVRSLRTNKEIKDSPLIAVDKNLQVSAIGEQAKSLKDQTPADAVALINPFAHQRVAITDVDSASKLLRRCIERLYGRTYFLPQLIMVICPPQKFIEDLSSVESSAFGDMGWNAGGREVYIIPTKIKLTLQDVMDLRKAEKDFHGALRHQEKRTGLN